MVPLQSNLNIINSKFHKDERYCVTNSRTNQRQGRSMIGYSQVINSGNQTISTTRTQVTIDGLGSDSYSTETLWSSVNNRINLQDAKVGDYINADVILPFQYSGLLQATCQLDYSATLDGSQVIGDPETHLILGSLGAQEAFLFTFKFVVTQTMKDNGIGIIATSTVSTTYYNIRLAIERSVSTTEN